MIAESKIQEINDAAILRDIVQNYNVSLKRSGANYKGCCPFHNEDTPSFYVSPAKGFYKCFGCGAYGHAVNFVQQIERITFPEACQAL